MHIAIMGTGNVGGALATQWSKKGHHIHLGVQDTGQFKGKELLGNENTVVSSIPEAVAASEVILIATPPAAILEISKQLGEVTGKYIIDATNSVMKSAGDYTTVYHFLAANTKAEVVKCFNTTGFENMRNPVYHGEAIDIFMAGDSEKAKLVARQLALDCGFGSCIDFGGADKVELLEKFAGCWINLAIMQQQGRNIAFRLVRR